jgi:DNA-binding response OmpR family regulator
LDAGMCDVLIKPIDINALVLSVSTHLPKATGLAT